jgi:hypothetical protein
LITVNAAPPDSAAPPRKNSRGSELFGGLGRVRPFDGLFLKRGRKRDAHPRFGAPNHVARPPYAFAEDQLEYAGNSVGRGGLQAGTTVRKIADRALDLGRFVAQDDLAGFENPDAVGFSTLVHFHLPLAEESNGMNLRMF